MVNLSIKESYNLSSSKMLLLLVDQKFCKFVVDNQEDLIEFYYTKIDKSIKNKLVTTSISKFNLNLPRHCGFSQAWLKGLRLSSTLAFKYILLASATGLGQAATTKDSSKLRSVLGDLVEGFLCLTVKFKFKYNLQCLPCKQTKIHGLFKQIN